MAAVPCSKCSKPVNDAAAVCPHCGARRIAAASPDKPGNVKMSAEEIQAFLITDADHLRSQASLASGRGVLEMTILPSSSTLGVARWLDIALTVACLPLLLSGLVGVALKKLFSKAGKASLADVRGGEYTTVLVTMLVGTSVLWTAMSFTDMATVTVFEWVGVQTALLLVRAKIRVVANERNAAEYR